MSVYGNSRPQFTDINGNPIQNGKLYIGLADQDPVANPATSVTDLAGAPVGAVFTLNDVGTTTIPFLIGDDFSQAVFDSTNTEVTEYQISRTAGYLTAGDLVSIGGQGGDWNSLTTYKKENFVLGSGGSYSISLTDSNLGNNPISAATSWSFLAFTTLYNLNEIYDINDSTIASNGKLYTSRVNGNTGNDPVAGLGVNWWGYQAPTLQAFTANGTWNRPDGCTHIVIEGVGGGGAGGGSGSNIVGYRGGGGGGAGAYVRTTLDVTATSSLTLVVGQGAPAAIFSASGGGGGATSIAGVIQANGGLGGLVGNAAGLGGLGGAATLGDVLVRGNQGTGGSGFNGSVTVFFAGTGADSMLGANGRSPTAFLSAGNTLDAIEFGAGGNGAAVAAPASTEFSSAAGADGVIYVHEYYD